MLSLIMGFLPGLVKPILDYLTTVKDAQVSMYQARTGASAEVAAAAIAAQAQVQTKWWFAALPGALIGMSIATYVAKAILWDKVLGAFAGCSGKVTEAYCDRWFNTDPMTGDLHWVFMTVIAGYFSIAAVDKFLTTRS